MDEVTTRETLKRQYFAFHNIHANGSSSAQFMTLDKLIQLGRHYLSTVSIGDKFAFLDFKNLLADALAVFTNPGPSILENQIKAGVQNLEKYGLNLCRSPWRKEFLVVKLYSGFFKCNVESNFKPARVVLEMFGYHEISPEELSIAESLDSKYFEDRLQPVMYQIKEIVFELFLMSVELTVLVPILEFANKEGYSLEDALKSRRTTKGDFQEAVEWLEKQAHKYFAPKRRKLEDDIDSMASLREDYPTLKGNGKGDVSGDGREKDEKSEDILQRHQQNREKYCTRTTPVRVKYVPGDEREEDEKSEFILQRHQQNREKYCTTTTPLGVKYPPGSGIDAGLPPSEKQKYRSEVMDGPGRGTSESVLSELVNSRATAVPVLRGYNMVDNEFDDADMYGHSGSGMGFNHELTAKANQPTGEQGLGPPSSATVVTPKITYATTALQPRRIDVSTGDYVPMGATTALQPRRIDVSTGDYVPMGATTALQPKRIDVSTGDYVPMGAFLNRVDSTDGRTDQDQAYEELWKCVSRNAGSSRVAPPPYPQVDDPPPPYNETRESEGYVVVENPDRNMDKQMEMEKSVPSKPKTQEPCQYRGHTTMTNPSENFRFSSKSLLHFSDGGHGRNRACGDNVVKDDMSALNVQMQGGLNIKHSSLQYEPPTALRVDLRKDMTDRSVSAVTSRRDKTSSVHDGSEMATYPGATRETSKQAGSKHRGMYSTLPEQRPTTSYRENIYNTDPTNSSWTRSGDLLVKQSTDRSLSTRSSTTPSNAVSSFINSGNPLHSSSRYSSPGSGHGNPPVSSSSSLLERNSMFTAAQSVPSSEIDPIYYNGTTRATVPENKLLDSKSLDPVGNIRKPQIPTSKGQSFGSSSSSYSSVKPSASSAYETALRVKLPPSPDTRDKESTAEKVRAEKLFPEKPKKHNMQSSTSSLIPKRTRCDQCQLEGASICDRCFTITCDYCQEIFDTDLCPQHVHTKEEEKGPHKFINLSKKRISKSKLVGQSSRSSERVPAGTPDSDVQPDSTEMEEWGCERCTMLNPPSNTVCFVCATTRGMQPTPSEIGSSVCGECTYHNKEGAQVCEVCHKTLDKPETVL